MDELWDTLKRWKKDRQENLSGNQWTTHDEDVLILVSCLIAQPKPES
jgi:hypothetical protein